MNKFLRKAMVLALAGTMTMGMGTTVFADDAEVNRNANSSFTESGTKATAGVNSFYLIKDYDSVNKTTEAPNSSSPAETFTYEITPYAVWNAGSTYADTTNHTGVATPITKENMPMLAKGESTGVTYEESAENRKLTVKQSVNVGAAKHEETETVTDDAKAEIKLPTYNTVGDYWYRVEETDGKTTGVIYGTNSNARENASINLTEDNANYSKIYYIHVQVTETSATTGKSTLVSNVTMHKSAPTTGISNEDYNNKYAQLTGNDALYKKENGNKVNAIENQYYAGNLVIKKEVTGNAGDKSQYFEVKVKFTKPAGTIINSDIPFTAVKKDNGKNTYTSTNFVIKGQNSNVDYNDKEVINWKNTQNADADFNTTDQLTTACTFWGKDNTTVTFSNIPYGINYEIEETQPDKDTYTHSFSFGESDSSTADSTSPKFDNEGLTGDNVTGEATTGTTAEKWKAAKAVGSITDANDTVTITNNKESVIDIGVITSNAPYVAVLILAVAALVIYTGRRKDMFEE